MDIRHLAWRHQAHAAQSGSTTAVSPTRTPAEATSTQSATAAESASAVSAESSAEQPAARSSFSRAGRLLNVLQHFEQRHPEETKTMLTNIADKLRSDAQEGGPWASRLEKWADRFQAAADTGDMSNLMPRRMELHGGHFGVRAYQQAQQASESDSETEEMVAQVADAALTESGVQSKDVPVNPGKQPTTAVTESVPPDRVEAAEVSEAAEKSGSTSMAPETTSPPLPGLPTADPSSMTADPSL